LVEGLSAENGRKQRVAIDSAIPTTALAFLFSVLALPSGGDAQ